MRTKLTPAFVTKAEASPNAERTIYWDEAMPGFGLMVTPAGHKSFVYQYRAGHRSRRMAFKLELGLERARKEARKALGGVAIGKDSLADRRKEEALAENTLKSIAEEHLRREGNRLRSVDQRRAVFERLIYPKLGARQIDTIRRSEIARLLDRIDDERGPVMADHALAILRRLMTWHAGRSDDFRSPIVRGMTRTSPKARARQRVLSDDELRALWLAAEGLQSPFGRTLQYILLTATRRNEAAQIRREELVGTDWLIPGSRHKSKRDFLLPLSSAATAILDRVPFLGQQRDRGFVFTTDGTHPLSGFSKFKRRFDRACGVTGWTIHDLRRTARSLMSRAGVAPDHAERTLGHVIPGIRGTYDLHEFQDEKRQALEAIALQIGRILGPKDNVVTLRSLNA